MPVVKLRDIVDALQMLFDETHNYLNKKTGEIVSVSDEEMRYAEREELDETIPEWQKENIKTAREVIETDDFIMLPSKFDVHEYRIMERFCSSLENVRIGDELYYAIKGSRAFRRFKEKIYHCNIEEDWYKYRDEALKGIAKEWCEENNVKYVED